MSPLGALIGSALVTVLLTGELFVLITVLEKFGLRPAPLEPDTWHGRPVSQADHEPEGPRFGFLLFMVALFVLVSLNVAVVDALLGLF